MRSWIGPDLAADTPGHVPVLLGPLMERVGRPTGVWLDGTFGAGGYSKALLEAGADRVIGVDRDPDVTAALPAWAAAYRGRLDVRAGNFADLDEIAAEAGAARLAGVVLDIGVSSMQLDQAARGFSFAKDGPLDMRMAQAGPLAADLVNTASEAELYAIFRELGEERAARKIARAIVADRDAAPFETTRALAGLIERLMPAPRPGQVHPATRVFQALRIAVNGELTALAEGLAAAERALAPGGVLAVVTFHSLEDRIVKRFFKTASGGAPGGSRYAPETTRAPARFELITRQAVGPSAAEAEANPRARSAKLRMARRTDAPAEPIALAALGVPAVAQGEG